LKNNSVSGQTAAGSEPGSGAVSLALLIMRQPTGSGQQKTGHPFKCCYLAVRESAAH
jgi:hypothetical protein